MTFKDTYINQALQDLSQETIIQVFIISLILLQQLKVFKQARTNKLKGSNGVLQNWGLTGTFIGIFISILYFDNTNISDGVEGFLGGMKICFLTSITGMIGELYLKHKYSSEVIEGSSLDDVVKAINLGNNSLMGGMDLLTNSMKNLAKSISGDNEGSLLNQMVLLRSHLSDKFDMLNLEFRQFAKLQAENNTKALVEAIREVIGDFNAKINEQFGENFKELNNAVGDLVTWQENYKTILERSHKQFAIAIESIESSKSMLEEISSQYKDNMKINNDVKVSMELIRSENESLNDTIEEFSGLGKEAKNAFPAIRNNIDELTNGFSEKVEDSLNTVTVFVEKQNKNATDIMDQVTSATENSISKINQSIEESHKAIEKTAKSMKNSVELSANELSEGIVKGFGEAITNIENLQVKLFDNMEKSILMIDDAHRQELEKSLHSLSNELASLSQKFVNDYSDLTLKMKGVIKKAEDIQYD